MQEDISNLTDFELQFQGYRLTTAEITYRMPDHHDLLQVYVWQNLDLRPDYPRLMAFLKYWEDNLDGPLFHVIVTTADIITPGRARIVDFEMIYE